MKKRTFLPYRILSNNLITSDTLILQIEPITGKAISDFLPGQYVTLKNPQFAKPLEQHSFSISSTPNALPLIELCIKMYGSWTQALKNLQAGQMLELTGPFGEVTWDSAIKNVVFLVGGIGISPIMSMIRAISAQNKKPQIALLYGSRTPETLVYQYEIENIAQNSKDFKIVYIYSHLPETHPWKGYRGFMTPEILTHEIDFEKKPIIYTFGPAVFVEKMRSYLVGLGVSNSQLKLELH